MIARSLVVSAALAAASLVLTPTLPGQDEARLLRFPHVRGDKLVFVKGGDVWAASIETGVARRLTSWDDGFEIFPRISPDGTTVAFSGEYGGTRQVFVVPFEGGTPEQLTFYPDVGPLPPRGGYDHLVLDWTPDGRHILVRANRTPYGERIGKYFLVPADGLGMAKPLQIPEGGPASFSPDASKLAYNIITREWRTWKRYTGGRAQDVYLYDLLANRIEQVTDFEGTDNWPMWIGDEVWFTSDRTGTLNLWCYDTRSKTTRQVTRFEDFDVLFPARGGDRIVFECGGYLYLVETATETLRKLEVTLADDRPWTRPRWKEGEHGFETYTPSPAAKRAVVAFRGDLFSVPREHGDVENLTDTPSRRERDPKWSPDGRRLAFVAEHGLDQELFVRGLHLGEEVRLTEGLGAWILGCEWAPAGDRIAAVDTRNRLWVIDVASRARRDLDTAEFGFSSSADWSADGRWITYAKAGSNGQPAVWVCRSDGSSAPQRVTDGEWPCWSPSFDPRGRWLYYVSARDWNYGEREFRQRVYAVVLQEDGESPVAPREDVDPALAGPPSKAPEADTKPQRIEIDFDGITEREVVLPPPAGDYGAITAVEDGVLVLRSGKLDRYDHASREVKTVLASGQGFVFTPDRTEVLYRHAGKLCVAKTTPGQTPGKDALPTAGVRVRVHPPTEWRQMYRDAWRIMRDWFYDPDMHGVDWPAMYAKYLPLVEHVGHRADLDFLLGELIGELNCGHTYVQPGETPGAEREGVGVLGCELEAADGRYRIATIFDSANWHESTRNPLTEPGVDVEVGDYLIAIDGHEITDEEDPYRHLAGKVGRRVRLLVNDSPRAFGAREVVVRPVASEQGLRYLTWVNRNRRIVEELSGGRIGYIHVPNTASEGHEAVWHGWAAQAQAKAAMIIDDRYNGGGHIPDDMAYRIGQQPLNWWARRHRELYPTPSNAFDGPRVMLINGYSSSGGDAFPYYFRKLGLGALMGRTTWGGLVGYSGTPRLVDGGGVAVPAFAFVNTDGQWDVEAYGVEPDIEVFDDPTAIQAGREPMLEAAVRHLLQQLEEQGGHERPEVPEGPDRRGLVDPDSAPFRVQRRGG